MEGAATVPAPTVLSGWGGSCAMNVDRIMRPTDEEGLAEALRSAAAAGLPVALRGCGHATNGSSAARNGMVVDVRGMSGVLEIDHQLRTVRVRGGTTWDVVARKLEPIGLGLTTQQEFHTFTVGGSLAANAHGKSIDQGPFSTAVRSLRLMTAEGSVVTADRESSPGLLNAVVGGHGLLGVVTEATLDLVDDCVIERADRVKGSARALLDRYVEHARTRASETPICFGFLSDDLQHGHYVAYRRRGGGRLPLDQLHRHEPNPAALDRLIAAQRRVPPVGRLALPAMWHGSRRAETTLRSRKLLLWDRPPDSLGSTRLQKLVVPADRFADFCEAAGALLSRDRRLLQLPPHFRFIPGGDSAVLPLAPEDSVCLVLCHLAQPGDSDWERAYDALVRDLVDEAVAAGGRHYLTFGSSATREQLLRAYPRWEELMDMKRSLDPEGLFSNEFHRRYEEAG